MGSIIDAAQPTMWTIDLKWLGLTFDIHPELQQNYGNAIVACQKWYIYNLWKIKNPLFPIFQLHQLVT